MTVEVALGAVFLAAVVAGLFRRRVAVRSRERVAKTEFGLDFTIDLVAVVLGSGGTVRQAVEVVSGSGPPAVRAPFRAVLDRCAGGELLVDGLASAVGDLGPGFHSLIGALTAAERDGTPVAITLRYLAEEADQARRWRSESLAKRAPVAMLAPMVICLLPAVVIGAVVPLAVVSFRQLSG